MVRLSVVRLGAGSVLGGCDLEAWLLDGDNEDGGGGDWRMDLGQYRDC